MPGRGTAGTADRLLTLTASVVTAIPVPAMPGSQGPFGWKFVANFGSARRFGKHPATGRLFGFYLRRRPGHIVEIAEVTTMVPGIAGTMLAVRLLRAGTPARRMLLSLLLLGAADLGAAKETKADDVAAPEFS